MLQDSGACQLSFKDEILTNGKIKKCTSKNKGKRKMLYRENKGTQHAYFMVYAI